MAKRILIIEDEKKLAKFVSLELRQEGYDVDVEQDGRSGLTAALNKNYDLIILEIILPEMDGFEVIRRLQQEKHPYIMMMTARDSVMDIVSGFDRGADSYITKPFAIEELLARVRAVFRRQNLEEAKYRPKTKAVYRDLSLDTLNRSAIRGGKQIPLSKREFELLKALLSNVNTVMTRETLLAKVWQYTEETQTNVVDVYVRYLRGKIDVPGKESYIQSVRGMGYVMREN